MKLIYIAHPFGGEQENVDAVVTSCGYAEVGRTAEVATWSMGLLRAKGYR